MIKLSDYIFKYLANYGVRHVFMLTGGGAMHLNDSIGKEKRIQYICNHHEQCIFLRDVSSGNPDFTRFPEKIIEEIEHSFRRINYKDIIVYERIN